MARGDGADGVSYGRAEGNGTDGGGGGSAVTGGGADLGNNGGADRSSGADRGDGGGADRGDGATETETLAEAATAVPSQLTALT